MRELTNNDMAQASGGAFPIAYGVYIAAGLAVGWIVQDYFTDCE